MVFLTLLKFAAIVVGLFLLPGLFLVRLLARGKFDDTPVAVAFAIGTAWTCFWGLMATGLVGLVTRFHLSAGLLVGIGVATTAACILGLRHFEGGFGFVREVLVTQLRKAFSPGLVLFLAFVSVVWLLSYDSILFDQERCVSRAGVLPYFDYLTANPPAGFNGCLGCFDGRNAFFVWNGGQRMGPSVFVAPFMALFGVFGFHLAHLFFGLLTAWFGYHLGRCLLGRSSLGYLLAAALALNPAVLSIPLEDENTMNLGLGTVIFYFLFRQRTQWFLAGMFLGLFLGVRHVGLLSVPALLLVVWLTSDRTQVDAGWLGRTLGKGRAGSFILFISGTVLFAAPCGIAHAIRFWQGGALFESFIAMPQAAHSLFGIEFPINGLLSWPFVAEPVRSPYNGFPTLVSFPLTILQAFGVLGIALVPVGVWWGWRRRRTATLAGLLWFLPQLALLCTMANWVEPNKMGIFLGFAQPIAAAIVFGFAALAETYAPLFRGIAARIAALFVPENPASIPRVCRVSSTAIFVGTALLLAVLQPLCTRWEAPVDGRNFKARVAYAFNDYPVTPAMLTGVEPLYARLDRERLTRLSLLPDFTMCRDLWMPALLAERWRSLVLDLSAPSFTDFEDRPKDRFHTLSGVDAPLEHTIEGLAGPDLRRGPRVLMADLMHRPISAIRDADAQGDRDLSARRTTSRDTANPLAWEGPGQVVRFDLTTPPATRDHPPLATGERIPTTVRVQDRIVVATDLPVPWADGLPCHLAMIPVRSGLYWTITWYGHYFFDHLAAQDVVVWLRDADPANLSFEVPSGSVLRFNDMTSVVPFRFHVWTALATPDLPVWGPVPSSY